MHGRERKVREDIEGNVVTSLFDIHNNEKEKRTELNIGISDNIIRVREFKEKVFEK